MAAARRSEHDAAHAFYMGVELARAEIACQLGKRYVQDEALRWGVACRAVEDAGMSAGSTLARRRRNARGRRGELMPFIRETIVTTPTPTAARTSRRWA